MELVVDTLHCNLIEQFGSAVGIAERFIQRITWELGLISLKKVVITGDNTDDYICAIKQHASHLIKHVNITDDTSGKGFAVVEHALNADNELEQIIFIRESMFSTFILSLVDYFGINKDVLPDGVDITLGLHSFMHEIGHALDYQKMYSNYSYCHPERYFILPREYDMYIYHEALTIWSEYYAECLANQVVRNNSEPFKAIADYLEITPYPRELDGQIGHSFRVAYWFAYYAAYCHICGLGSKFLQQELNNTELGTYFPVLIPLFDLLAELIDRCDNWDFPCDSKRLAFAFDELIKFEQKKYS